MVLFFPTKIMEEISLLVDAVKQLDELFLLVILVALAMASKAKLLLHELKTVKAEHKFLKSRCIQLEVENTQLRDGEYQGDDFVRQQLESLLAEKQRLAQENANYARENELLHEVVEYHQHTLQQMIALMDDRLSVSNDSHSMDLDEDSCHDQ